MNILETYKTAIEERKKAIIKLEAEYNNKMDTPILIAESVMKELNPELHHHSPRFKLAVIKNSGEVRLRLIEELNEVTEFMITPEYIARLFGKHYIYNGYVEGVYALIDLIVDYIIELPTHLEQK